MIVGTNIFHDGTGTTKYYSPEFGRGGLAAVFSLDVTHKSGSPTMGVDIEHRNADEQTFTTAASFSNITATGVTTKDATSLKEIIRLSFAFSAGSAGDFFHVVMTEPAWRPYD